MENIRRQEEALGALLLEGLPSLRHSCKLSGQAMDGRLPVLPSTSATRTTEFSRQNIRRVERQDPSRPSPAPAPTKTLGTFRGGALRIGGVVLHHRGRVQKTVDALKEILSTGNRRRSSHGAH